MEQKGAELHAENEVLISTAFILSLLQLKLDVYHTQDSALH